MLREWESRQAAELCSGSGRAGGSGAVLREWESSGSGAVLREWESRQAAELCSGSGRAGGSGAVLREWESSGSGAVLREWESRQAAGLCSGSGSAAAAELCLGSGRAGGSGAVVRELCFGSGQEARSGLKGLAQMRQSCRWEYGRHHQCLCHARVCVSRVRTRVCLNQRIRKMLYALSQLAVQLDCFSA